MSRRLIAFPPFRLDVEDERLWDGDRAIRLRPKTFAVLRHLTERPRRLVTKGELLGAVWRGVAVTDDTLTKSIRELREVLGDDPRAPRFIETVPRRGFRWIAGDGTPAGAGGAVVGRTTERLALERAFDAALRGERQLVFLTGEAGIGKTTLVESFVAALETRDGPGALVVARGQCIDHHGPSEPYMPILDAFAQLAAGPAHDRLAAAFARHAPTWLLQIPSLAAEAAPRERAPAASTRERMLREFAVAITAFAASTPIVLVLEDLHWSDRATVDLLALLARRREPARLLVVGTVRPVDLLVRDHPLAESKAELVRQGHAREILLEMLTAGDLAAYLTLRLGAPDLAATLAPLLHARTDGNPFFMVAAVDHLIARGLLVERAGRWTLAGGPVDVAAAIPESVRDMIERQLDALAANDRTIVEAASVAGAEFAVPAVAAAVERDAADVEARCATLARRGQLLRSAGDGRWPDGTPSARFAFVHGLFQSVLYDRLTPERRARLHRGVAERLERAFAPKTSAIAAELAGHFEQAGEWPRAITYVEQAARRALRRGAPLEATRGFERALGLAAALPANPERAQQLLLLTLEHANAIQLALGYGSDEVERAFVCAQERAVEMDAVPAQFLARAGVAACNLTRGRLGAVREDAARLHALAARAPVPGGALIAHTFAGMTSYLAGDFRDARDELERALACDAEQAPGMQTDFTVLCLAHLACTLAILGFAERAREAARASRDRARATGLYDEAVAAFCASGLAAMLRDTAGAEAAAADGIALTETHGFPLWLPPARVVHGWAIAVGRRDAAGLAELRAGLAGLDAVRFERDRTFHLMLYADALMAHDGAAEAATTVTTALDRAARTDERCCEAELWRLRGELSGGARAREYLGRALDVAQRQAARCWELRARASLARLA